MDPEDGTWVVSSPNELSHQTPDVFLVTCFFKAKHNPLVTIMYIRYEYYHGNFLIKSDIISQKHASIRYQNM